ncbi:hypothetical protein [Endozoicomonas sp. SESOKO1]|uniref:hypothetical protein n=1 Tax=Endozoicomonas sp. SESOKO1 TaxID=2828742 RepID=UPI002147399B|nr:hypothetical protein [Endozoicomonas sp. SESOKO1]
MNTLPIQSFFPGAQTRDVAIQTETSATNDLGREIKLNAPYYLYSNRSPDQRTEVCEKELSRKIEIIRTNASLINFPLIENTLLGKYDLFGCIANEQGKRFIAECAIARTINVQMPTGKTEGRLEGGYLQYLGDCINSLETLMSEGWDKDAAECLKKNLFYEITRITIPGQSLSADREAALKKYILEENQALFVNDAAAEQTVQGLNLYRDQLAYQNALGIYPRTPQLFDLTSPQTIIDIEANRIFPGDEPRVKEQRDDLQEKMTLVLAQMTTPDSALINMILDDKRAAGMLADDAKKILRTALTDHHGNMPIPSPAACLFYYLLRCEFPNSLISLGLDPKAMVSMIYGCLNMHNLVKPNQKIQQVKISWELLCHAWWQSGKATSELPSTLTHGGEKPEWIKEFDKQLTYVPNTNFFRVLNTPSYSQKLGITPRYAPEYRRNNELSGASGSDAIEDVGNVVRKRPATTDDTALHPSKMTRPTE